MKLGSVLFFGRKDCKYSLKLKNYLRKESQMFRYIDSSYPGEKLNEKIEKQKFDYIFCFRSFYILKKKDINKTKIASINFHPGTPEYRGIGCINFAIYNNEKFYGSTAHLIDEKIDNGKILDVKKFQIRKKDNLEICLNKTHRIMTKQAFFILKLLKKNSNNLEKLIIKNKKLKWSKKLYKKKDLEKLYLLNNQANQDEIRRVIRATKTKKFRPYKIINKKKYFLI